MFKALIWLAFLKAVLSQTLLKCEPLKSDLCLTKSNTLLYNFTGMPNFVGHKNQADAIFQMSVYYPLISTKCSEELQLFLCSTFVPLCSENSPQKLIGPCKGLCQKVRNQCEPVLVDIFHVQWPKILDCDKFPESNEHKHMCITIPENGTSLGLPTKSIDSLDDNQLFIEKSQENQFEDLTKLLEHNLEPAKGLNFQCKSLKKSFEYVFVKKKGCIPKCDSDILYSKEDKEKTRFWTIILASLCFLNSTFTVIIYLINR